MIFCFSGTGNSLYVAKKLSQKLNDEIVMITEDEISLHKKYEIGEEESLGFVFPIYWWGMPKLVEKFVKEVEIIHYKSQYSYAVVTFGLAKKNGAKDLKKTLRRKQILLNATFEVKMVDNYVVGYELASQEKQQEILQNAEVEINRIVDEVYAKHQAKISDLIGSTLKPIVHKFYKCKNHRKKFYVTNFCTGCGACMKQCPCSVIQLVDGKPKWESDCSFCLKCVNKCPQNAIQYGKGTENRARYRNPNL